MALGIHLDNKQKRKAQAMGVFLDMETQRKFMKAASNAELQRQITDLKQRLELQESFNSNLLKTVAKQNSTIREQDRELVLVRMDHVRIRQLKDDLVFECEDLREDVGAAKEANFNLECENKRLQEENKRLKEKNKSLQVTLAWITEDH